MRKKKITSKQGRYLSCLYWAMAVVYTLFSFTAGFSLTTDNTIGSIGKYLTLITIVYGIYMLTPTRFIGLALILIGSAAVNYAVLWFFRFVVPYISILSLIALLIVPVFVGGWYYLMSIILRKWIIGFTD